MQRTILPFSPTHTPNIESKTFQAKFESRKERVLLVCLCCGVRKGGKKAKGGRKAALVGSRSPPLLGTRLNLATLVLWAQRIAVSSSAAMVVARSRPPRVVSVSAGSAAAGGFGMIWRGPVDGERGVAGCGINATTPEGNMPKRGS